MTATESAAEHAAALHRDAIVIDGHSDILMSVADRKMRMKDRVAIPDEATWEPPMGWTGSDSLYGFTPHTEWFATMGMYDIPRLLEGGVTSQACAIYIDGDNLDRALHRALDMTYWLRREAEESPDFALVTSVQDLLDVKAAGITSGFLTFEGFEPLENDLKLLDIFYALGLRMASLTHSRRNYFADGTQSGVRTGGLSGPGQDAVRRMNELGIVIDLAHLNIAGCWEVVERSEAPIVLSHTSPARHFPEDASTGSGYRGEPADPTARALLDAIAAKNGVVGIIAYNQPSLDVFVDEIEYVIKAVGDDHVALGTDFYGMNRTPKGFETIAETPRVTEKLVERGYSDETIRKVLGGNYLRVFKEVWR